MRRCYGYLFARESLYKFNKLLFDLGLRGMGVLNFENDRMSGELHFFRKFLAGRPGLLVMDVGANRGTYAGKVRASCPDARIYAFEPHPSTFRFLRDRSNIDNFEAINLGLGDIVGSMRLFDRPAGTDGTEHASLYREVIEDIHRSAATEFTVGITTVDDFAAQENIRRIDLLKIDTEGNELKVLQGAKKSLEDHMIEMVQIEFNAMNTVSRVFFRDFRALLADFDCYRLLPVGMLPITDYNPLYCELFAFQNLLFIRRGSSFNA
jgi:FkbM family methyltransferase